MLRSTGITESALYVDDLDRAVHFYTTLLACQVLRRDRRFCALRIADTQVLLLFLRGGSAQPIALQAGLVPAHDGNGPVHVCFGIQEADVMRWERRLHALGVPIESRVLWPAGATSLYFRDPDGHAVELATPGIWPSAESSSDAGELVQAN